MPRTYESTAISHDNPDLIMRAKAKAKRLHMSFSGYVVSLIEKDLIASGDAEAPEIQLEQRKGGALLSPNKESNRVAREVLKRSTVNPKTPS